MDDCEKGILGNESPEMIWRKKLAGKLTKVRSFGV